MHDTSERRTWGKARIALAVLVLAGAAAGGLKLASHESKLDTQVLGATAKKPPATPTITSGPSGSTKLTSATFVFSTNPAPTGYLCKLDGGSFLSCTSPKTYNAPPLGEGAHTFQVEAQDSGFTSNPASRTWTVDLTRPQPPVLTKTPEDPTIETKAQFNYRAEAAATFACTLNGTTTACDPAGIDYKNLAPDTYTFTVVAIDAAGNHSDPSTPFSWTVLLNKSIGISGDAASLLYPGGGMTPIDLKIDNPYNFSIQMISIDVVVPTGGCASDLEVRSLALHHPTAMVVPANRSVSLSTLLDDPHWQENWPADWPAIRLKDTSSPQDTCQHTTFRLSYTGTATK